MQIRLLRPSMRPLAEPVQAAERDGVTVTRLVFGSRASRTPSPREAYSFPAPLPRGETLVHFFHQVVERLGKSREYRLTALGFELSMLLVNARTRLEVRPKSQLWLF